MTSAHPTFYPDTQTWEVEGYPPARTLRELAATLPPRTHIEGYAPGGYRPTGHARGHSDGPLRSNLRTNYAGARAATRRLAAAQAQERVRPPEPPVVTWAPSPTRAVPPPPVPARAAPRLSAPPQGRTYDHDRILDLWAAGKTAPEIAAALGMPRWQTVNSIVCDHRRHGDPRATPRNSRGNRWSLA